MRKWCLGLSFVAMVALAACGGDSSSKAGESDTDEIVAESVDDLPNCTKKREGQKARTDEGSYVCTDGVWKAEAEEIPSYETEEDVPACTKKKEGSLVYVEDTKDTLICESGEWKNVDDSDDDETTEDESSSSDEETDDESSSSEQGQPECELTVATEEELPICTKKRDGITACIDDIGEVVVCESGMWSIKTSSSNSEEESSSSEEPESSSSEGSSSSGEEESSSSISLSSSDASIYNASSNSLTDLRDGQVYRTTTIDIPAKSYSEVWMAENLNFMTENSWCGGGSGTTEGDCSIYGRLYKWAAAVAKPEDECGYGHECSLGTGDIRGACPKGWHVPSYGEWDELFTAVGGSSVAGKVLKSETGWQSYSGIENSDTYLFSALPAGFRDYYGNYYNEGDDAYFWSSTEYGSYNAYGMYLYYSLDNAYLDGGNKGYGYSVRCLKD